MKRPFAQLSFATIPALVFILSLIPFLIVQLFHSQLYRVMDISSYLVFHNIAEFFSVMVSLSIFGVGWYTYDHTKNRHALFLSAAFLAIGLIDLMHTLGYAGMPAFITANSANKSTEFWIAARMFTATAFLASAYIYPDRESRWISKKNLLLGAIIISGLIFIAITFFPAYVPATFIPGIGLTPFKKISEYLIILLLFAAAVAYWKRMLQTSERLLMYYISALIICIFSEQVFAIYQSVFDTYNVLGHIYKIVAFFLIYKAVFAAPLTYPYEKLAETNALLKIDIIRRQQADATLQRLNRELRAISNCSLIMMHAEEEQSLLDDICCIICEEAGYRMFWVGYAENDEAKTIRPVASAGYENGYISEANLSWADDIEYGQGPAGNAIRSGNSICSQDITSDPQMAPWRENALRHGYRSGIALPLKDEQSKTFGVLMIYSSEINAFTADEKRLLEELAENLSFGIMVLRARNERKKAEDAVKEQRDHLEELVASRTTNLKNANTDLEAFSYSISHDLRAPLRAIDGFSRILEEDYADILDSAGKQVVETIHKNISKMNKMIDDLLAFAQTTRQEVTFEIIDIDSLVKSVIIELKDANSQRDLQFITGVLPPALGKDAMIRQIFVNLLSNSVKFTSNKEHAIIEVGSFRKDNKTVYFVKDNGAGFNMAYADKIFNVFQRLHSSAQFEGTGIGLAIVHRIIEKHGESIWLEAKENEGATFYFTLRGNQ